MSDEIRIISVELENYRQYYGKNKIEFSSRDEGFTIIAGKNGEGKSNLLNAINWCFFHDEPHGVGDDSSDHKSDNKSLSVINTKYIVELDKGKSARTSVKILIRDGDTTYSISRVLQVIKGELEFKQLSGGKQSLLITNYASDKVPSGCEIFSTSEDFVIKKKGPNESDFHDTVDDYAPATKMEEILPHGLSKYFLLDGEFLEDFWKKSQNIQNGIEQISQLHLLSSLVKHVDKMLIPPKGIGKDTDKLTTSIQNLKWFEQSLDESGNEKFSEEPRWKQDPDEEEFFYHATGEPRISDLEKDIKKIQAKSTDLGKKIRDTSVPNHQLLKDKHDNLQSQFNAEKDNLDKLEKTYRYNLVTKSPYLFLKKAIYDSVNIIEERIKLGDLPIRQRRQFAEDLLTRGNCICGEKLNSQINNDNEMNQHRINIEKFKDNLTGKDDLDTAVDMRYDFIHDFIEKYDVFLKSNFGDPRKEFIQSKEKYDRLNRELKGVATQLKNSGDADEVGRLIDDQAYLIEQIKIKTTEIANIRHALTMKKKERTNLSFQLNKELKKDKKAKKLSHEIKIWNDIYAHVNQVYDELKDEIRLDVQKNTEKHFKQLLANPSEFETFKIESDYSVYAQDKYHTNKIHNLSAGQSLILTLAFVAAIREPTGYKFPLIVDSPLGKIDSGNRHNIGTRLPDYLPKEQLILLVTDTEYTAYLPPDSDYPNLPNTPVAKLLESKVPLKHFKIKKDKTGSNTGNSSIKAAKLVFDENRQGWMVI